LRGGEAAEQKFNKKYFTVYYKGKMKDWFNKVKAHFSWFLLFKYAVYGMLVLNVFLFFNKELAAAAHRFSEGMMFSDLINAFPSTIDTAAWVILILLFELETFILPDEQLKGGVKWGLRILRGFSYVAVYYAFYGYLVKYNWVMDFMAVDGNSLCQYIGQSWMIEVDEYQMITQENCNSLNSSADLFKKSDKNIFTDALQWAASFRLALTDVFNAAAWILVVIVLEFDIWLQLKQQLTGKIFLISKIMKGFLYAILLAAAIYWGIDGSFLEFWDAFLWIIAFVFIENNLFEWQQETAVPTSIF
jgi:hypothetical protein